MFAFLTALGSRTRFHFACACRQKMASRLSLSLALSLCACQAVWATCPEGWTTVNSACYRSIPGQADQPTAESLCQAEHEGAVLPSIHDITTNSILLGLSGNLPFWTGLSNHTGEGKGLWTWQDGSSTDFYNWAPGMPVLDNGRKSCVWVYEGDGSWSNAQCNLRLGDVLCQL